MKRTLLIGYLVLLAGCGGGYRQTYQEAAGPAAPPVEPRRQSLAAVVLAEATPDMVSSSQRIEIERTVSVEQRAGLTFHHTRYAGHGRLSASSADMVFGFGLTPLDMTSTDDAVSGPMGKAQSIPHGLGLTVSNNTGLAVVIEWGAVNLIVAGRTFPMIHRGVRLSDRKSSMAPSTIPSGASLDDFVYPRDLIAPGRRSWVGVNFFEAMKPGQTFTLHLPIKRNDTTTAYHFRFEIHEPGSSSSDRRSEAVALLAPSSAL